uniref:Esag12 n=1 Tax=Trypanosoma brucei brucei (strain 927/4 GUTat10.1) TaxID=185431 RepID=G1CRN8_TRYB2|nr:esag12 [Trypanosoma brucei brucei TREU927]
MVCRVTAISILVAGPVTRWTQNLEALLYTKASITSPETYNLKAREPQNNNTSSDTMRFSTSLHRRSNRHLDRRCEYIFGFCSIKGNSAARRKKFLKTPLCQRYLNN